jgi:hippurate hydrolase
VQNVALDFKQLLKKGALILCLLSFSRSGSTQDVNSLAESELASLVEVYQHLHSHPELSYHEEQTAAYLADRLRSLGYDVTEGVGRYNEPGRVSYGLVGVMKNGAGPTAMVRTDLDGLPVSENTGLPYASQITTKDDGGSDVSVMHACGHDVHMASFLGTATLLSRLKDEWSGTLVLIGQPAEERGSGARAMLNDGLYERFPRPDFALALHSNASLEAGKVGYRTGYTLAAVDSVDITVRGEGGHGAYPHTTKDPIVLASRIVVALQTIVSREVSPLDSTVVTVGSIHGGSKHNIIPDQVHLQLTVRSYKPEVRRRVLDSIRRIALGVAASAGVPDDKAPIVEIDENEYTPTTYNNPELTERLVQIFERVLGPDNVIEMDPVMAGEDFSRYSLENNDIPISMFWLGTIDPERVEESRRTGTPLPSLHSSLFAPVPEPTLVTGVTAMTSAVLDLMRHSR